MTTDRPTILMPWYLSNMRAHTDVLVEQYRRGVLTPHELLAALRDYLS